MWQINKIPKIPKMDVVKKNGRSVHNLLHHFIEGHFFLCHKIASILECYCISEEQKRFGYAERYPFKLCVSQSFPAKQKARFSGKTTAYSIRKRVRKSFGVLLQPVTDVFTFCSPQVLLPYWDSKFSCHFHSAINKIKCYSLKVCLFDIF